MSKTLRAPIPKDVQRERRQMKRHRAKIRYERLAKEKFTEAKEYRNV